MWHVAGMLGQAQHQPGHPPNTSNAETQQCTPTEHMQGAADEHGALNIIHTYNPTATAYQRLHNPVGLFTSLMPVYLACR